MVVCHYHNERDAVTKCERCNRMICVQDRQIYRKKRSSGQGEYRRTWVEKYEYCPVCHAEATISDVQGQVFGGIIMAILAVFAFSFISRNFSDPFFASAVGFGYLILGIIIVVAIYNIVSAPARIEQAKKRQTAFLNSLQSTPDGIVKRPQTSFSFGKKMSATHIRCNQCGSSLSLDDSYCSECGDTTKDEIAMINS